MQPKRLIGMCVAAAALAVAGPVAPAFGAGADQTAGNSAESLAANSADTTQGADQSQWSSSNCEAGCGGSGQAQELAQIALTEQNANSEATANQNGVNANVPVSIGGGDVYGGNSAATQTLYNSADSSASNSAGTTQGADQSQSSSSSCKLGCGGSGQAQSLEQVALTAQDANSEAEAYQNGVNANTPVAIVTPKQGKQVSAKHRGKKSGAPPR